MGKEILKDPWTCLFRRISGTKKTTQKDSDSILIEHSERNINPKKTVRPGKTYDKRMVSENRLYL